MRTRLRNFRAHGARRRRAARAPHRALDRGVCPMARRARCAARPTRGRPDRCRARPAGRAAEAAAGGLEARGLAAFPHRRDLSVVQGADVSYLTADGKYFLDGNVYDMGTRENLTEPCARARGRDDQRRARIADGDLLAQESALHHHGVHRRRLPVLQEAAQRDRGDQQARHPGALSVLSAHGAEYGKLAQGGSGVVLGGSQRSVHPRQGGRRSST